MASADSIVRLKVDSQEYEAKIKRASSGLRSMEEACRKVGGTFEVVEKEQLAFVQALGKMQTVSNTAKGKIGELTTAFTDLSTMYNRLTDAEKKSPFGKALAGSLDELKGRIKDGKKELDDIGKSINGGSGLSGALDSLAGKFGMNISQLTSFGALLGTATGALKVAKDAFFQSESNIDAWGTMVKQSDAAYKTFLDTLNTGNWSNFFKNLNDAINGASDLYSKLDRLGSIKSNNQAAIAIKQKALQDLRLREKNGEDVKAEINKLAGEISALQKQGTDAGMIAGRAEIASVLQRRYQAQGNSALNSYSLNSAINSILNNGQSYFDTNKATYEKLKKKYTVTGTRSVSAGNSGGTQSVAYQYVDMEAMSATERAQYKLAKTITEGETEIQQGIQLYAQSVQESAGNIRQQARYTGATGSGSGGKGGNTSNALAETIAKAQRGFNEVMTQQAIDAIDLYAEMYDAEKFDEIKSELEEARKTGLSALEDLIGYVGDTSKSFSKEEIKSTTPAKSKGKNALTDSKAYKGLSELGSGISQIGSSIEGLGINLGEGFNKALNTFNALMGIVQGVQTIISAIQIFQTANDTVQTGLLTEIAAATTITAGATSLKAVPIIGTLLAHGGIVHAAGGYTVPGNFMSGDNVPAMLNSGELVLNKAQQGNLASQLNGGGMQAMHLTATIKGEDIRLALNNNSRRRGRGEYVTSR